MLTAVGVLVAAEKLRTADSPDPRTREALAVLAGVLWPVLLAGAIQLCAIRAIARRAGAADHRALLPA